MNRLSGTMRTARTSAWLSASSLLLGLVLTQAVQSAPQGPPSAVAQPLPATIEFNRDIRPILSDKCYPCHGPGTQMATLRFDSEEGAKQALRDGRFAIVPGDPARSELIARVTAADPAVRMPRTERCRGRRAADRPAGGAAEAMDRAGRDVAEALVVHPAEAARPCRRSEGREVGAESDRCVRAGAARA